MPSARLAQKFSKEEIERYRDFIERLTAILEEDLQRKVAITRNSKNADHWARNLGVESAFTEVLSLIKL